MWYDVKLQQSCIGLDFPKAFSHIRKFQQTWSTNPTSFSEVLGFCAVQHRLKLMDLEKCWRESDFYVDCKYQRRYRPVGAFWRFLGREERKRSAREHDHWGNAGWRAAWRGRLLGLAIFAALAVRRRFPRARSACSSLEKCTGFRDFAVHDEAYFVGLWTSQYSNRIWSRWMECQMPQKFQLNQFEDRHFCADLQKYRAERKIDVRNNFGWTRWALLFW